MNQKNTTDVPYFIGQVVNHLARTQTMVSVGSSRKVIRQYIRTACHRCDALDYVKFISSNEAVCALTQDNS